MHYDFLLAEQYRKDREREAQRQRLIQSVKTYRPGPVDHVMVWTGRRLVALGQLLQARSVRLAGRSSYAMEYPAGFLTPQL
jgi:hypothetical protein